MFRVVAFLALWFIFSGMLIFLNRYILVDMHLPHPITLTAGHMLVATIATRALRVGTNWLTSVDSIQKNLTWGIWSTKILPIGVLFSLSLLCANYAFLFLSVSFMQMLKSATPVAILLVSWVFGTEKPNKWVLLNIIIITAGVSIASYGEIKFSIIGFTIMVTGICTEAVRLVMIQELLNGASMKMDPLTSLYYFAPISAGCGIVSAIIFEVSDIKLHAVTMMQVALIMANMIVSFGLNVVIVFTIKETSTLILGLAGVLKDMLIVISSAIIWEIPISALQGIGYLISLIGLICYKFEKQIYSMAPWSHRYENLKDTEKIQEILGYIKIAPYYKFLMKSSHLCFVLIASIVISSSLIYLFSDQSIPWGSESYLEPESPPVSAGLQTWATVAYDLTKLLPEPQNVTFKESIFEEIFPMAAEGKIPQINPKHSFPKSAFRLPLFFGFTTNWNLLQQAVVSYLAAGWPPNEIFVVDNSGTMDYNEKNRLSPGNSFYLNYTRLEELGVNVIRTPALLTFAQLQNFYTDYALLHDWPYYLWSHSDVVILPMEEKDPYKNVYAGVADCFDQANKFPNWSVLYFHYDWFSVVNVATMRFMGGYDTMIPHYKTDCDLYYRMELRGMNRRSCNVAHVFDVATTIPDLSLFYPLTEDGDSLNTKRFKDLNHTLTRMQKEKAEKGRNYWQSSGTGGSKDPYWRDPRAFRKSFYFFSTAGGEVYEMKWGTKHCNLKSLNKTLADIWKSVA